MGKTSAMDGRFQSRSSFWMQMWMLTRKNFASKWRKEAKELLEEIVYPILSLAAICFCYTITLHESKGYSEQTVSFETPSNIMFKQSRGFNETTGKTEWQGYGLEHYDVHIAPKTGFTASFAKEMQLVWDQHLREGFDSKLAFTFHNTEDELVQEYMTRTDTNSFMGLVLPPLNTTEWDQDLEFKYKIRLLPNALPTLSEKKVEQSTCRGLTGKIEGLESDSSCPVNKYFSSNFLALQQLVELTALKQNLGWERTDATAKLTVMIENFPKQNYVEGMSVYLRIGIPLLSVISISMLIDSLLVEMMTEKTLRIKDGLRMVGVSDAAYWLSWINLYGLFVLIFAIVFSVTLSLVGMLGHTNPLILFLLFLLFGLSVITFSFTLTPFFYQPQIAGIIGTMVLQLVSLLFLLQTFVEGTGIYLIPLKYISSLAFTTALDEACRFENYGGIQWIDLVPGRRGEGILYSLLFLSFDIVFYLLLGYCFDRFRPNEYGVQLDPLFFLKPRSYTNNIRLNEFREERNLEANKNCEPIGADLQGKEAIRIHNIKKTFASSNRRSTVKAVKGISMDVYEGQITAILGTNGAGKSTLLNMLTGLVVPTSGNAEVYGLNISQPSDMKKLRKIVGVCLQHDTHFGSMTILEHLTCYGKLKGLGNAELEKEVKNMIDEFRFNDTKDITAEKLSDGERRKLSIAIALMGDPKIILLDEPSTGLDPVSRRHFWKLLQRKKEGKVILLTTHCMDEADILADRKAIIHEGLLKCIGSSMFLKNRYGVGYYLTVEMNDRYMDASVSDRIIEKWIPKAVSSKRVVGNEIKYSLPHSESSKFSSVFAVFEREIARKETMNSYGVSMMTLEEVFLKISNDMDSSEKNETNIFADTNEQCSLIPEIPKFEKSTFSILRALSLLRFRRAVRSSPWLIAVVSAQVMWAGIAVILLKSFFQDSAYQLRISNPLDVYPRAGFRIPVNENGSEFINFLRSKRIAATSYSGNFEDLLEVNIGKGSLAAVNIISEKINPSGESELNVLMRINGTFLHAPALTLDLITKYFSQTLSKRLGSQFVTTSLISNPLPQKDDRIPLHASSFAPLLLALPFIFPYVRMIIEIINDTEMKIRNQLRVNGVSVGVYFGSYFPSYTLLLLLTVVIQFTVFVTVEAYMTLYPMLVTLGIILLFTVPAHLFTALISSLLSKPQSANSIFFTVAVFSVAVMANILFPEFCSMWLPPYIPTQWWPVLYFQIIFMDTFPNHALVAALHTIFCFSNVFYIPFATYYWTNKQYMLYFLRGSTDAMSFSSFATQEIMTIVICLLVQILLYTTLIIFAEAVKNGTIPFYGAPESALSQENSIDGRSLGEELKDEDVAREKARVVKYFSGQEKNGNCILAVNNLQKSYKQQGKILQVLDGVDLMVEKGEIFGLLGRSGAGKTITVKMITREVTPNAGKVKLFGYDIWSDNYADAFDRVGLCSQQDPLWYGISLREHLELYAIITGIPTSKRKRVVENCIRSLRLQEHSDKYTEELSGGTRRKLSFALSLMGAPKLVLMDEPTVGMDPQTKRFVWNALRGALKDSRSAVLTTQSMEEANALCTRVGILVNGNMLCIGSSQQLKKKFSKGYILEIKLQKDAVAQETSTSSPRVDTILTTDTSGKNTRIQRKRSRLSSFRESHAPPKSHPEFKFVLDKFPSCQLLETCGNYAVFSLPNDGVQSISKAFADLDELKLSHNIGEYSLSQTSLEQVFLTFVRDNEENGEHQD